MAKMYIHTYRVEPSDGMIFPFPIDMLRYDNSYPDSELDSSRIIESLSLRPSERERGGVDIRSIAHSTWTPRDARWRSFGWKVVSHGKRPM